MKTLKPGSVGVLTTKGEIPYHCLYCGSLVMISIFSYSTDSSCYVIGEGDFGAVYQWVNKNEIEWFSEL